MTDRDFLLCALHLLLDEEEGLERLCPDCRIRAEEHRCAACGQPVAEVAGEVNPSFDWERFERMKRGEKP